MENGETETQEDPPRGQITTKFLLEVERSAKRVQKRVHFWLASVVGVLVGLGATGYATYAGLAKKKDLDKMGEVIVAHEAKDREEANDVRLKQALEDQATMNLSKKVDQIEEDLHWTNDALYRQMLGEHHPVSLPPHRNR